MLISLKYSLTKLIKNQLTFKTDQRNSFRLGGGLLFHHAFLPHVERTNLKIRHVILYTSQDKMLCISFVLMFPKETQTRNCQEYNSKWMT